MAVTMADVRAAMRQHRLRSEVLGVALLALFVFVGLGLAARRRLLPIRTDISTLRVVETEISTFRSAFQPLTPQEDADARLPDDLQVGVAHDLRVSLAEQLASGAERRGLSGVRVRFAGPDSAAPPAKPDMTNRAVALADYSLALECSGSFGAVLSLINQLPPSIALQRLVAIRTKSGTQYSLTFAVFETVGVNQHG